MKWSKQQDDALCVAGAWLKIKQFPYFYLAGYAGSGKSSLAKHIASHQKGKVRFAAYTGKAARVMRDKGCVGAQTIHSLIYFVERDGNTGKINISLNKSALDEVSLVVIDECSMVDDRVGTDLLSFGVPILVLGDPAQLPPIRGCGYFTSRSPNFMLTEVHRQAAESPIIRVATDIREGRFSRNHICEPGLTICGRDGLDQNAVTAADAVIVGRNRTRQAYNARLRELKGLSTPDPLVGEPLICLRNDAANNIWNGEIYNVKRATKNRGDKYGRILGYKVVDPENKHRIVDIAVREEFFRDGDPFEKIPFKEFFGQQQFTYGYTLTCHKAQGSQWPNVCVFDESRAFGENADRHLYTAVTRASENLTLVI